MIIMQRQHLPVWHRDYLSYDERMYRFFRDYRRYIERGLIASNREEYRRIATHEDYYNAKRG